MARIMLIFKTMNNENKYYLTVGRANDLKNKKDYIIYRTLEIAPAAISWLTLIILILLSYFTPILVAFFIIIFDFYWLIKTIYLSFHLRYAYRQTQANLKINWLEKIKNLKNEEKTIKKDWQELYHLIMFPMYNESHETVKSSFEAIINDDYPKDKMIVVLATEERGGEQAAQTARKVKNEFENKFFKFLITVHPKNLPEEIPGKGSNLNFSGKTVKKEIIDQFNIPYENIIVSAFDIDTRINNGYFACLTYNFLTAKKPLQTSYQPIPFFVNNIWEAPHFSRIVSFSATFWHMLQQERPERLTTFSSHSMPFKALVDVGFWQKNIVSEDSRIFWQNFLHYNGDWRVKPLYFPIKMDANIAQTATQTYINLYKQQRRWAYGVENIPYFILGFIKNKLIPLRKKIYYIFTIGEGFHSWATNSLIIFIFGWLPLVIGGKIFKSTLISYNLPILTRDIMILAMIGMITSAVLSIDLLPPRPAHRSRWIFIWLFLQWIFLPSTIIIFGAIPALDAQTRLMIKKYLGFWVTPK